MSNLVGPGPDQIPSNSMLGSMAYQDAASARVGNLNVTGAASFGKSAAPIAAVDATSIALSLVTNSAATYTVLPTDKTIVQTTAACTVTLPAAASFPGRELEFITHFAGAVVASLSIVVPITGGAPGTAILPATAGKSARLQSNGTNWLIISAN